MKQLQLPDVLPIFPLPGALLLPRSRLPLHLFEPRYLAMLDETLKSPGRMFGMIQPMRVEGPRGPALHRIGCAGRVTQFSETEDGRYMITLSGVSRFRLMEEVEGFTPFRRARVSWEGFDRDRGPDEKDSAFNRASFLDLLHRFLSAKDLSTDWDSLKDAEDEFLINALSMMLDFPPEDKQALLEAPSLSTRRETLVTLMEFSLHTGDGEERLQ